MFSNYQTLSGEQSGAGKPNRDIQQRVKEYELEKYLNIMSEILDIGCNKGFFGIHLSPKIKSYTGIDIDKNQIYEGFNESEKRNIRNVNLVANHFELMGTDKKFTHVFSFAVHCYITMLMPVYGEKINALLKPNGFLFIEGHPNGYEGEPERYWLPLSKYLNDHFGLIKEKIVTDRELKRVFRIYQKPLYTGMASQVFLRNDMIEKHYFPDEGIYQARHVVQHFEKERRALTLLDGRAHFPMLIGYSYKYKRVLKLSYCGERITKETLPPDWEKQCQEINKTITEVLGFHNDIKPENITVKNGILYLIDFGLWSPKESSKRNNLRQTLQML